MFPLYLNSFIKHCSHIFAPTAGMQSYLQDICKISPDRISVLPTGIEREAYSVPKASVQELRQKYHAENIPLLISVSRMANEKNVSFLLEGIAKVKKSYKGSFKVLLIGDGPEQKAYEKQCEKLHIEEKVCFTGQIPNEEISPYFAAADAFLFASKTETQGIVILEAFAGHTPVYALKASGVEDLVKDGWNGRLCQEDADCFAKMLLDLLEGREDAQQLAAHAYETALEFQEDAVAREAVRQYNRVVAANNRRAFQLLLQNIM